MKFNKLMIFSIIMIAILALGAVSATDLDSMDEMGNIDEASIDDSLSVEGDLIEDTGDADTDGDDTQPDAPENDKIPCDYDVSVPDEFYPWDADYGLTFNITMPEDADGSFDIYVNDTKYWQQETDKVHPNFNQIYFSNFIKNLSYGYGQDFNLKINYHDDSQYKDFDYYGTFHINYIKFEVPGEISTVNGVYQFINVTTPYVNDEVETGKVALFIDGKQIGYARVFNGYGYPPNRSIYMFNKEDFKGISYGKHNYEIRYFDGKYPNATKKGTINVVFYGLEYFDDIVLGSVYNEGITVNLPFDAFGTLKLIADGNTLTPKQTFYREDMTTYVFNLSSLACKEYNATIVYSGDGYYPAFNRTVSFNLDYLMDIYPDNYTSIDISELKEGVYNALVIYDDDSKYPPKTVDLTSNNFYTIYCNSYHDIFEDTYVTLKLPDDATGNLLIVDDEGKVNATIPLNGPATGNSGNVTYIITESNGFKLINCTIPNTVLKLSDPEEHVLNYTYDGTDYNVIGSDDPESSDYHYIAIRPRISMPNLYVGEDANFTFEMPENATGRLLVLIEDKVFYNATLKNGKTTFKLPNSEVGDYYWYYEYSDPVYGYSRTISDLTTFRVMAKAPVINITKPTYFIKNCYNTLEFKFPNTSFNGELRLKLDYGNYRYEYITVPIVKGVGGVKILPKYQGKVRIFYDYAYDYYAAYGECFGDFKVFKLTSPNLVKNYTDSKKLTVKIVDNHNKVVKDGQVVKFYLNGKKIGNATTKNGVASLKINLAPGTYKIKVYYKGAYVFRKVTVKPILTFKAVKVKRSAKKLVLKASLKKVNNKYIVGKYITFKFNGKTYKAKTNKKGIAKVTIKRSVLKKLKKGKKIKYQATYLKNTVKRTAKVLR